MITPGFLVGGESRRSSASVKLFPEVRAGFLHFVSHARLSVTFAQGSLFGALEQLFPGVARGGFGFVISGL